METPSWDQILLEEHVQKLVASICAVVYHHGITEIHLGGLMRLVGIDEASAAAHDDEIMLLGPDIQSDDTVFGEEIDLDIPSGTTIH